MLALLAATVAAAPAPPPDAAQAVRVVSADGVPVSVELVSPEAAELAVAARTASPMPNLYQVPERCRNLPYRVVDQFGRPMATRLADLPQPGGLQLLVDRRIKGCRVITVKHGRVAPDEPDPPSESYRIRPLDRPGRKR